MSTLRNRITTLKCYYEQRMAVIVAEAPAQMKQDMEEMRSRLVGTCAKALSGDLEAIEECLKHEAQMLATKDGRQALETVKLPNESYAEQNGMRHKRTNSR